MKTKTFWMAGAWVLFCMIFIFSCGGDAKDYLKTPEDTLRTYLNQARKMKTMIDPLAYSRAVDCFSISAQETYKANANSLVTDKAELDGYTGSRREAYVFTNYILPKGPDFTHGSNEIEKVSQSGKTAAYTVNGMEVTLVKEGKNWRIEAMFGM